jgi:excisionase family DNA binding protein
MTTIVKPITRKPTASVAGARSARPTPEPSPPPPGARRRPAPVARTVIDLTTSEQPAKSVARTATQRQEVTPLETSTRPAATTPPDIGPRPVLSVAEAAEMLGVSEWLVLQQIRRGELPHKRCGRRIVLSRDRLLAWLNDE